MPFQRIGMVWHFETEAEFADVTNPDDGMLATIAADDTTKLYIVGPGWITLYGERDPIEFGITDDPGNALLFTTHIGGSHITATNEPSDLGDRMTIAVPPPSGNQQPYWITPGYYQASPTDPVGTTGTDVMMGLAGSITTTTTRAVVTISGLLANTGSGNVVGVQIRYGSGTAPSNGAAAAGTAAGAKIEPQIATGNRDYPFSLTAVIDSLSVPDVPKWLDLAVSASAGTSTVKDISISAYDF